MAKTSAGILLYRLKPELQVLLAHPGGPFWAGKDDGAWTIPKGEIENGDDALATAIREFEEETGALLTGPFQPLGSITQKSGKRVEAWACAGDLDPAQARSNRIRIRWQGREIEIPEIDRVEWFSTETALWKINPAQAELIARLLEALGPDESQTQNS